MDIRSNIYVRKIININSSPNILKIKDAKADPINKQLMEIFIKGQQPLNEYIDNFTFPVN